MARIKERYLLINILTPTYSAKPLPTDVADVLHIHQPVPNTLTTRSVLGGIQSQMSALFGDLGSATIEANAIVKYLSKATSTFILKVRRSHYRLIWAALSTMTYLTLSTGERKPCTFQVVRVSGTIRKAEQEAMRQAR
ncbi:hypothetical protein ACRALDRAFT_2090580, partial [Sodiomyces alcalophilus JCM 7366]|uniref:uncharacterized protein n=1 Tax=Sodiomyces alcalophilus JCM 7366 TaxID=591952 RepID=UPI0039B418C0